MLSSGSFPVVATMWLIAASWTSVNSVRVDGRRRGLGDLRAAAAVPCGAAPSWKTLPSTRSVGHQLDGRALPSPCSMEFRDIVINAFSERARHDAAQP